jgi:hypothetical protein
VYGCLSYSDPFGLCPPEDKDDGPHCHVVFLGLNLNAVIFSGVTLSIGVTYSRDEGFGVYERGGVEVGLDVSFGVEGGYSSNRAAFDGPSLEACAGGGEAASASACVAANENGVTLSGSGGASASTLAMPVTDRSGGTITKSYTYKDFKHTVMRFAQGILNLYHIP